MCTYGLSAPLVARLVSKHGARLCCILGALFASLGILAASFTTSIGIFIFGELATKTLFNVMNISGYSIISGVGFGLMYIPSIVIVSRYLSNFPKDGYPNHYQSVEGKDLENWRGIPFSGILLLVDLLPLVLSSVLQVEKSSLWIS